MSDEQQSRAEWVFPEQPKKRAGRVWLIIGVLVAALIVVGTVLFFTIPREEPSDQSTGSTIPSAPATDLPSEPITTPPAVPDPDIATFVGQVQPWLDDGATGLGMVANLSGQDAEQVVDSLQGDADRLSNVVAPSSISSAWYDGVSEYAGNLRDLRSAIDNDEDTHAPLETASTSLQALRTMIGL